MRLFEVLLDNESFIAENETRQFRIVFTITIDFGGYNSYCDLAIYNLSESTEAKLIKQGTPIGLRAGYSDAIDYIFLGKIQNAFKERNGPDRLLRIIARGGTQDTKPTINKTFGKNAKIVEMIEACCTSAGYPPVIDSDQFSSIEPYARGKVLSGDPLRQLDALAQTHDFSYVLENDRIVIVKGEEPRQGEPHIVSLETGMEGIPEITETGCDVKVRLNPKIKIGGKIDIQSELKTFNFSNLYYQDVPPNAGSGEYKIFKLEHTGDSYGDDWNTRITGIR